MSHTKRSKRVLAITSALSIGVLSFFHVAQGAIVFSEDFSALTGPVTASDPSSERGLGTYLTPVNLPGWTMQNAVFGFDRSGDLAVSLQENGAGSRISRTITGLLPGLEHTLSFEYWGDNVTAPYSFYFEIDGTTTPIAAIHSGQNTGQFYTQVFNFTPQSTSTTLKFVEKSATHSSPVLDNIIVSVIPEPSVLLLGAIAAMLGTAASNRRKR